jgi:opacity protein-like surface antigen
MGCKGYLRTLAVSGAALAFSGAFVQAADMPEYPLPPLPKDRSSLVDNGGWYLRGDLGGHWGLIGGAASATPPNPINNSLGNGMTASLGAGIKSKWLRTDVTVDYASPVKYQGTVLAAGDTTAKIQATTALLNGYIDLGTWYHITPYIGGGVGAAYARVSDYVGTAAPPVGGEGAKSRWNFAWAGMAGVAVPVSTNMMVDVGYRYLNIGDLATANNVFAATTFKNLAAHEVRVGLRWSFDDLRYTR